MSLLQNNMVNNFLSSVTGNTNKAYILLNKNPDRSRKASDQAVNGMANLASLLQTGAENGVENVVKNAVENAGKNQLSFTSLSSVVSAVDTATYLPVQVQYNPNTISFSGTQGRIRRSGVGGQDQVAQLDVPVETVMSVELTFDDTNIKDAFMFEKLSVTNLGGIVQTVEDVGRMSKGGYSVQDISEVFVGAMVRPSTRWVAFVWNKMIFWGELTSANVRYTMFNPSGSPIRSKVTLRIRQDARSGENRYATEKTWENAFDQMFKTKYKTNGFNVSNKVSNFLNF